MNEKGEPAKKLPSTFEAPVDLEAEVSVEEFLDHYITSIYTLKGEENCPEFVRAIAKGPIYTFQFSFRGALPAILPFLWKARGSCLCWLGKRRISSLSDWTSPGSWKPRMRKLKMILISA